MALPDYQCADAVAEGQLNSATDYGNASINVLYLVWNKRAKSPGIHVRDYIL